MSLRARIDRLEGRLGSDTEPRRVVIWAGPWYEESWVERSGSMLDFFVRIPDPDADPMDFLTDRMREMVRPSDQVTIFELPRNGRNPHLQPEKPPWKRRPYRLLEGGGYELEIDGVWVPQ